MYKWTNSSIDVLFLSLSSLFLLSNHLVRILLFIIYGLIIFFFFFLLAVFLDYGNVLVKFYTRRWKNPRRVIITFVATYGGQKGEEGEKKDRKGSR